MTPSTVPFPAFMFAFACIMDLLSIVLDLFFGAGIITSFIAWPVLYLWALSKFSAFKMQLKGKNKDSLEKKFMKTMMRKLGINALIEAIPFVNMAPGYILFVVGMYNNEQKLAKENAKNQAQEQKMQVEQQVAQQQTIATQQASEQAQVENQEIEEETQIEAQKQQEAVVEQAIEEKQLAHIIQERVGYGEYNPTNTSNILKNKPRHNSDELDENDHYVR